MSYHNQMINIQAKPPADALKDVPALNPYVAYKTGHRDARHAAAEIVNEADAEIDRLRTLNEKLAAALSYPRYGDTATLIEKAADNIDSLLDEGWKSHLSPHLRRAAKAIRAALAEIQQPAPPTADSETSTTG